VAIEFTFDAQNHLYLVEGRPEVLERKRIIGEYVHKATQYLDEGCLDLETIDPEIQGYLSAYGNFIRESGFRPQLIEHRLVDRINGMLCGGTIDRTGAMAGKLWIIDLKCIDRLYPAFALQTAGYELLLPKPIIPPFKYDRAVLQLKRGGSYKFTSYNSYADLDVFRAALAVSAWKMNHGMDIQTGARTDLDEAA